MTYKELVKANASKFKGSEETMWASIESVSEMLEDFVEKHPDMKEAYWEFMREQHEMMVGHHFNEPYAKWQVAQMHHKGDDGTEYKGEHWPIEATNSVLAKYRPKVTSDYNEWDFYVALNASYHDFCAWVKRKFAERYEEEVIDLALTFWFLDEDWPNKSKVWDYYKEK